MLLSLLGACDRSESDVLIFVAASAADAVEAVAAQFESDTGVRVTVNAAASSVLAQQVAAGAEADLFLSANVRWVDYLEPRHYVRERIDFVGNELVLVVPRGGGAAIASPQDLLREKVRRVAVADPDSAPAGEYAKHALTNMGLWAEVQGKLLPGGDVRQALVFVERGDADAGIVYATDAALTDKVRVVYTFDREATEPIVYPLVLLNHGEVNPDAVAFFEYLQAADARAKFVVRGFVLNEQERLAVIE